MIACFNDLWQGDKIKNILMTVHCSVHTHSPNWWEGLEATLARKKQKAPSTSAIFDGEAEAKLIALACSKPPEGHARWSLRLLEKRVVALGIVEKASDSTIYRVLKKTRLNRTKIAIG